MPTPAVRPAAPDLLIVISHLGHGGTQRVVCNLANALAAQGFRVHILLTKRASNNALALDSAVDVENLDYHPPKRTVAHLAGLYAMGRWLPKLRARIRAIGAPCVVSFIRPTNVKVLAACLGLEGQRVVVCDRNDPRRQPLGFHWMLLSRLLYRTADLVTCNSKGVLEALVPYVEGDRLRFLPNILTEAPAGQAASFDGPAILSAGRVVPQKGYDVLIEAFAAAGEKLAGWRLVILGEGPEQQNLQALAERLGVADRLAWPGHVPDPFAYYRAAAIFALTSRYEGMPNALMEAMNCGLPCIVSDASPGPLELIRHEANGLVTATDSVPAVTAALVRLAGDAAERDRLGAAAAASVEAYRPENALNAWKQALGLPKRPGDAVPTQAPPAARKHPGRGSLLARRIGHYLARPRMWPDLARWLAKRVKDRVVGRDEAALHARLAMAEGTAWCAERACSPADALAALGIDGPLVDLQQRFPQALSEAETRVATVPFRLGGASNMDLIYTLCEGLQASRVIETGVANGWSSLAILLSISTRSGASLHSIDLPYPKMQNDPWVGIAVPQNLHPFWTLHRTADRDGLPKALAALRRIDLAHYDSDKSVAGRRFAYPLLWAALRPGGLLFSDDINDNFGFRDFCDSIGQQPLIVQQGNRFQGILRKPDAE